MTNWKDAFMVVDDDVFEATSKHWEECLSHAFLPPSANTTTEDVQHFIAEPLGSPRIQASKSAAKASQPSLIEKKTATEPFPFMRLPCEIRRMIYKEHLVMPGFISMGNGNDWVPFLVRICVPHSDGGYEVRRTDQKSVCSLFMVSKTIYGECAHLYFRLNTFQFGDLDVLSNFLKRIGPDYRRNITTMRIRYYGKSPTQTTKLLGQCVSLQRLYLTFYDSRYGHELKESIMKVRGLRQLLKLRGLKKLELCDTPFQRYPGLEELRNAMEVTKQDQDPSILERQTKIDYPNTSRRATLRPKQL